MLERTGGVSDPDLLRGDWWRLLTSCFVHVGALHLAVNMLNPPQGGSHEPAGGAPYSRGPRRPTHE